MRFRTVNAYLKFSQDVEKDDFKTFGTFAEVRLDNEEWVFDVEKVAKSLRIVGVSTKSVGRNMNGFAGTELMSTLKVFDHKREKLKG